MGLRASQPPSPTARRRGLISKSWSITPRRVCCANGCQHDLAHSAAFGVSVVVAHSTESLLARARSVGVSPIRPVVARAVVGLGAQPAELYSPSSTS